MSLILTFLDLSGATESGLDINLLKKPSTIRLQRLGKTSGELAQTDVLNISTTLGVKQRFFTLS